MVLDRAERRRKDEAWLRERLEDPRSRVVTASQDGVALHDERLLRGPVPQTMRRGEAEPILLGLERDAALFACDAPPDARVISLRDAGARLAGPEGGLAAYAVALLNWHRRHRFCANCGRGTLVIEAGYARRCPQCGAHHFPRLDPVVIMLVEHGARVLLGRHSGWPRGRFSALAGYVAPGEGVEEAVVREVLEESGIVAYAPRFIASQPWPFPSSLMLGFHARSDGGTPTAGDGELEEVRWFSAEELRRARARGSDGGEHGLHLPPSIAIARFLIERWLEETETRTSAGM
jgi:NAD+ diphosphatase